jgi:hypothetical protein
VWASAANPGKETTHWNGTKWTSVKTGGGFWEGMSGVSATDVWGIGGTHTGHWNGSAWTLATPFGSGTELWSVTTVAGNAWLVGDSALIAHLTF